MTVRALDHVALEVRDLPRTLDFYTRVLGLRQLPRPGFTFPGAWLAIGERHQLHILVAPEGAPRPGSGSRGNHFAIHVDGLDGYHERLLVMGIAHRGPVERPDRFRQIFLEDPDGHTIELVEHPSDK